MKARRPKGGGALGGGNLIVDVISSRNYPRKSETKVLFIISYGPLILKPPSLIFSKTTCKHRIRKNPLIFQNHLQENINLISENNSNITCNCLVIINTFNEFL